MVTLTRSITMHDLGSNGVDDYNLTLLMDMNFESIERYCSEMRIGRRGYVFILNDDGTLVYHPQQHVIYSGMKVEELSFYEGKSEGIYEQDGRIISIAPVEPTSWRMVGISYLDDYQTIYREIFMYSVAAFAAVMALAFLLANVLSRRISRPIKRLAKRMETVEEAFLTWRRKPALTRCAAWPCPSTE